MNRDYSELFNFEITDDDEFIHQLRDTPHELAVQMEDLYMLSSKGRKSGVKRLQRLIEKYPNVPILKSYLATLYNNLGFIDKYKKVNQIIIEQHPDYFFGRLNLAAEYYFDDQFEKMPEILGENFDLKQLYPERDVFHVSEVSEMFRMAILYYSEVEMFDEANIRLDFLKEKGIDDDYEVLRTILAQAVLKKRLINKEKEISVDVAPTLLKDNIVAPVFQTELIKELYCNSFDIDRDILDNLLKEDREILIDDLNKVLKDSIERYKYFLDKFDEDSYNEDEFTFLLHALFLLGELEASESLGNIFEVLSQDYDFIEFYISDILTEYWGVLYKIANQKLNQCMEFMKRPGVEAFHKIAFSEVAAQIVFHQPNRREEVVNWYRNLFNFFLNSSIEDNVIDSNLLGMMISDVVDFKGIELLPEIEQLFVRNMVDTFVMGDINAVRDKIKKPFSNDSKRQILDLYEIYDKINEYESDDDMFELPDDDTLELSDDNIESVNSTNSLEMPFKNEGRKIGRNEPCPCGSGKKYKKCCMP